MESPQYCSQKQIELLNKQTPMSEQTAVLCFNPLSASAIAIRKRIGWDKLSGELIANG